MPSVIVAAMTLEPEDHNRKNRSFMKHHWMQWVVVLVCWTGSSALAQTAPQPAPPTPTQVEPEEPAGPWARAAIQLMFEKELFIGYPEGNFDWTKPMTRQEAAVLIARLITQFGLDRFNPEEIALMQRAIGELQSALQSLETRLRTQLQSLQQQLEAQAEDSAQLNARVKILEVQVERLLEIIAALRTGATGADVAQTTQRIEVLTTRLAALEQRQAELERQLQQPGNTTEPRQELQRVQTEIARLNEELRVLRERLSALETRVNELTAEHQALAQRIAALEARGATVTQTVNNTQTVTINLGDLQRQSAESLERLQRLIDDLDTRLNALEKRVTTIEERLTLIEARLRALERALQDALSAARDAQARTERLEPVRAPFYIGLVANRTFPLAGAQGRVIFGNDSILENLGLRGNVEFTFGGATPGSVSLDLTARFSLGAADGYIGMGGGVLFFDPLILPFSELLIGANYRILHNVAVFLEARIATIYDPVNTNLGALDFGLQFRF
jgi:predicted nuclease with TOPRIM domain